MFGVTTNGGAPIGVNEALSLIDFIQQLHRQNEHQRFQQQQQQAQTAGSASTEPSSSQGAAMETDCLAHAVESGNLSVTSGGNFLNNANNDPGGEEPLSGSDLLRAKLIFLYSRFVIYTLVPFVRLKIIRPVGLILRYTFSLCYF